jgi:hypothetical protein
MYAQAQACERLGFIVSTDPSLAKMAWSRDNIIAMAALIATCAPIFILLGTFFFRRRQQCDKGKGIFDPRKCDAMMLNCCSVFGCGTTSLVTTTAISYMALSL